MILSPGGRFRNRRRWDPALNASKVAVVLWIAGVASLFLWQWISIHAIDRDVSPSPAPATLQLQFPRLRPVVFDLSDFGGVGDGATLNTEAFERAVSAIGKLPSGGGGQLNVPAGRWLTAPFNLTSHMTLFLSEDAVILGVQDEHYWPLLPPLPSYGFGRDHKGPRYGSLIHGQNLMDVVITGHNGTIDGQGGTWWKKFEGGLLNHTRGPLMQIMWSKDVVVSNITLRDSPFWTLHPYDCKNVTISNVTILAPLRGAPNTDGIDPDSCEDMVIENCYISVGDDGIAIKSGWDRYGISYGRPSTNILIRNLTVQSVVSAGISIGSEMSGGVSNVTIEDVHFVGSKRAVRIKTAVGRGGYVRGITYRNMRMEELRGGIVIKTDYNEHPPDGFDPDAVPVIEDISFEGIRGRAVRIPVHIQGSEAIPVRGLSFRDVRVGLYEAKEHPYPFRCAFVEGRVVGTVLPKPCDHLDVYDDDERLVKRGVRVNNVIPADEPWL